MFLRFLLFLAMLFLIRCDSKCHLCLCPSARRCVGNNIMLLTKAFKKKFIIPNFSEFTHHIDRLYDIALRQEVGQVGGARAEWEFVGSSRPRLTVCLTLFCCRWLITSRSWPSSALISGEFLCAPLTARGTVILTEEFRSLGQTVIWTPN